MKVLVFAHRLEVGGTQHNAIELAATLRDRHGFDPVLFAELGPAAELAEQRGLRVIPAPPAATHPSPARGRALRAAVKRERPDLIHVWDWPQCLDAYYAVHLPWRTPMLCTVMDMAVPRLIPLSLHTTFGTPHLVDCAKAAGRRHIDLLMPPVDVRVNAAHASSMATAAAAFRREIGARDDVLLVLVGRLVNWLKGESLRRAIDAVGILGRDHGIRLAIVGDGHARDEIAARAARVNAELAREAILLTGELVDPRPVYCAADLVLGMGSSSLRGLAFGKPLVVIGERGFSRPFTTDTAPWFLKHGMYGVGRGLQPEHDPLVDQLRQLLTEPARWEQLGAHGRRFVVDHFALDVVAAQLAVCCETAASRRPSAPAVALDGVRTAVVNSVRLARELRT